MNPRLLCPNCREELTEDSLTEICGYCCLNENCYLGVTLPDKLWYLNGDLHREDGPAVELSVGTKYWYINGELHREDGPAVEYYNGSKQWWINGEWKSFYDIEKGIGSLEIVEKNNV